MTQTSPDRPPHIVIFDSGVGGLSILEQARRQLPGCRYTYLSDNGGFPYGNKPDTLIIERTHAVIAAYFQQTSVPVDVLVIACNTASTLALPKLREHWDIPIVGVVPAIKPAASLSAAGYIGLLATPGTIGREYTRQLIHDYAPDCRVICVGSGALVAMAEAKLRNQPLDSALLAAELVPFLTPSPTNPEPERLDCLVLACTHFPLLNAEIQAVVGASVQLLDSGDAIARRIAYWCENLQSETSSRSDVTIGTAWFTRPDENLQALGPALSQRGLAEYNILQGLPFL